MVESALKRPFLCWSTAFFLSDCSYNYREKPAVGWGVTLQHFDASLVHENWATVNLNTGDFKYMMTF